MRFSLFFSIVILIVFMAGCGNPIGDNNPTPGSSALKVSLEITSNTFHYAEARAYDSENNFINDVIFTVDGILLTKQSSDYYFSFLEGNWTAGSAHTYTIETPDGYRCSGSLNKPIGMLSGVTYTPDKPALATSYVVTPPYGSWPAGSFIDCLIVNEGVYIIISKEPVGTLSIHFSSPYFLGASSVSFKTSIINKVVPSGYAANSIVSIKGDCIAIQRCLAHRELQIKCCFPVVSEKQCGKPLYLQYISTAF